jgi:uncharacterized membrane protein YsdA (DUF1294 family)/cold shock CspA family protein
MRFDGVLKSWNDERGFGFLEPVQGGEQIFVHIKAFPPGVGRPQLNQAYSFEVELGPKGKRAKNVQTVRPRASRRPSERQERAQWGSTATLFAIPAFLVVYGGVAVLWRPTAWVAALYLGMSALTFVVYAADKAAAEAQSWRTPESTLHVLALAGGWPGALVAQQFMRHKSTKQGFREAFWSTVMLNVVGFVVLCSPWARQLLPAQ